MKKITVLGSTGSIGKNTLKIAEHLPDTVQVVALAAHSNIDLLEKQIRSHHPEVVAVYDPEKAKALRQRGLSIPVLSGMEGLIEVAGYPGAELAVVAIVGMVALLPALNAIKTKKNVALANKEILVSAGKLLMEKAHQQGVSVLPVDSEHSAIFQCLQGERKHCVKDLILTASGGPFYRLTPAELKQVTPEQALMHPNWKMGPKVTVDSSTLMNKGLEMIEAKALFGFSADQIKAVIHPQSIIHSMVEMIDGSILAQMSEPNMMFPIQYALTYPERKGSPLPSFDFSRHRTLDFYPPDEKKFPAIALAAHAMKKGGSYLPYLNAANEVLVDRFLMKEIAWVEIIQKLDKLMGSHRETAVETAESIFAVDAAARQEAQRI